MDSQSSTSPSSFAVIEPAALHLHHFASDAPTEDIGKLIRHLGRHSKNKDLSFLRRFLNDATSTLREELCLIPGHLKAGLPPFENVLDLAELPGLGKLPLGGTIESTINLVVQLGLVIGLVDTNASCS